MFRFIKSQATSFFASLLDFAITIICAELLNFNEEASIVVGNIAGGILYYALSRIWVFQSTEELIRSQFLRYWIVWLLNFSLNFIVIVLLIRFGNVHYLLAKTGVALVLSMSFNYLMNRKYVFKQ